MKLPMLEKPLHFYKDRSTAPKVLVEVRVYIWVIYSLAHFQISNDISRLILDYRYTEFSNKMCMIYLPCCCAPVVLNILKLICCK